MVGLPRLSRISRATMRSIMLIRELLLTEVTGVYPPARSGCVDPASKALEVWRKFVRSERKGAEPPLLVQRWTTAIAQRKSKEKPAPTAIPAIAQPRPFSEPLDCWICSRLRMTSARPASAPSPNSHHPRAAQTNAATARGRVRGAAAGGGPYRAPLPPPQTGRDPPGPGTGWPGDSGTGGSSTGGHGAAGGPGGGHGLCGSLGGGHGPGTGWVGGGPTTGGGTTGPSGGHCPDGGGGGGGGSPGAMVLGFLVGGGR